MPEGAGPLPGASLLMMPAMAIDSGSNERKLYGSLIAASSSSRSVVNDVRKRTPRLTSAEATATRSRRLTLRAMKLRAASCACAYEFGAEYERTKSKRKLRRPAGYSGETTV